jgi:hypothetical protein
LHTPEIDVVDCHLHFFPHLLVEPQLSRVIPVFGGLFAFACEVDVLGEERREGDVCDGVGGDIGEDEKDF